MSFTQTKNIQLVEHLFFKITNYCKSTSTKLPSGDHGVDDFVRWLWINTYENTIFLGGYSHPFYPSYDLMVNKKGVMWAGPPTWRIMPTKCGCPAG